MFEPLCPACGSDLVSEAVSEAAPVDPRNVYAATKVQQEYLVAAYGRVSGAPVISLRYHNVFGPRCPTDTPYSGVASLFIRSTLQRGQPPRVFEDGGRRRDFVHVPRCRPGQPSGARGRAGGDGPLSTSPAASPTPLPTWPKHSPMLSPRPDPDRW